MTRDNVARNALIVFLFLCLLLPVSCAAQPSLMAKPDFQSEFEGGKLYQVEKLPVLVLRGNYREMGRQYGALMKDKLNRFYDSAIEETVIKKGKQDYESIKEIAYSAFDLYPERYKNIFYGLVETSGMDLDKLVILDQVATIVIFVGMPYCTGMATWGDYTGGGPLVFGRNWDMGALVKDFGEFLTLVAYNPDDGSIPTATFGYSGQIVPYSAISKAGLLYENNEAVISAGRVYYDDRESLMMTQLDALFSSSTMEQFDVVIKTARSNCSAILNVANKEKAYSYECAVWDVKRRSGDDDGLLVATNHFIDPTWGISPPYPEPDDKTLTRRENLLNLGKKYKGRFNPQTMMDVFDTTIPDGGPTWPLETNHTTYQFVAVPENLLIWFKAPGYMDWTGVDLKQMFD